MKRLLRASLTLLMILALATGCSDDPEDKGEPNQDQDDVQDDSSEQIADADASEQEVECESATDCTEEIPEHARAICHANRCSWTCDHCETYKRCHLLEEPHPTNPCRICGESGWEEVADGTTCGDDQTCQAGQCT